MKDISVFDDILQIMKSVAIAIILEDENQAALFQRGLDAIMKTHGHNYDPQAKALSKDIAKALVGDLTEENITPTLDIISNTLKETKSSDLVKRSFLNELDRFDNQIKGSSYRNLNHIATKVGRIEKHFMIALKEKRMTFAEQLQVFLKIIAVQTNIDIEAKALGQDGVPFFKKTAKNERMQTMAMLYINIVTILKYKEVYKSNTELVNIINEILIEISAYHGENIDHLLILVKRANEIIEAYHSNKEEIKDISPSLEETVTKKIIVSRKPHGLLKLIRGSFSGIVKLIGTSFDGRNLSKKQSEFGSPTRPNIHLEHKTEGTILKSGYYDKDAFYIRRREEIIKSFGLSIQTLCSDRRNGLEIGCTKTQRRCNSFRMPIDITGLSYYYYRSNSPKKLEQEPINCDLKVVIEKVTSHDSKEGEALYKVEAMYLHDGSLRIDEYRNEDVKNIYQSYSISIAGNKLLFRVSFVENGKTIEILVIKELKMDTPAYMCSYLTKRYVKIDGEVLDGGETVNGNLEDGLSNLRDTFDISKYKNKRI